MDKTYFFLRYTIILKLTNRKWKNYPQNAVKPCKFWENHKKKEFFLKQYVAVCAQLPGSISRWHVGKVEICMRSYSSVYDLSRSSWKMRIKPLEAKVKTGVTWERYSCGKMNEGERLFCSLAPKSITSVLYKFPTLSGRRDNLYFFEFQDKINIHKVKLKGNTSAFNINYSWLRRD